MEATGLVLGVVPLLISAADSWKTLRRVFRRYQDYDEGFRNFHRDLQTQTNLFCSEVKLLLVRALDHDQAANILKDKSHALLSNPTTNTRVSLYLESNFESCFNVVEGIEGKLKIMQSLELSFSRASSPGKVHSRLKSYRVRKHDEGARIRWTFAESGLKRHMEDLKQLNQDFRNFTNQAERLADLQVKSSSRKGKSSNTRHNVKVNQAIQSTSKLVYSKLAQACTKHAVHRAYFSLRPWVKQSSALNLRFDMSYFKDVSQEPAAMHWFSVESIAVEVLDTHEIKSIHVDSAIITQSPARFNTGTKLLTSGCMSNGNLRKRPAPLDVSKTEEKAKKSVRFQRISLLQSNCPQSSEAVSICGGSLDLCTHLLKLIPSVPPERECLGILERSPDSELMLYLEKAPDRCHLQASLNLSQILSRLQANESGDIPPQERIRFAKLLAVASSQFHSTPWLLNGMWRSEHLCILGLDISTSAPVMKLSTPYMDVAIEDRVDQQPSVTEKSPWIRNPVLFSLGIILIELGFQQPFAGLRRKHDDKAGYTPIDREFASALRISATMSGKLGPRYQEVVEKCLMHNFGNLAEQQAQERFHAEVIDVLDDLQRDFDRLYLN